MVEETREKDDTSHTLLFVRLRGPYMEKRLTSTGYLRLPNVEMICGRDLGAKPARQIGQRVQVSAPLAHTCVSYVIFNMSAAQ